MKMTEIAVLIPFFRSKISIIVSVIALLQTITLVLIPFFRSKISIQAMEKIIITLL